MFRIISEPNFDWKARKVTALFRTFVFATHHLRIVDGAVVPAGGVLEGGFRGIGHHDKMDQDALDDEAGGD